MPDHPSEKSDDSCFLLRAIIALKFVKSIGCQTRLKSQKSL